MRGVDRASLGSLSPPSGKILNTKYAVEQKNDRLIFVNSESPKQVQRVQLALGSGKTGMTYVQAPNPHTLIEMPMSYFPNQKQWLPTPGMEITGSDETGHTYTGNVAARCLLCHSVTLNTATGLPKPEFFGVGCESCHGPGSAHVTAMRSGDMSNTYMEKLGAWSATRLNEMCGRCHGTAKRLGMQGVAVTKTHRFQPYGLMNSRCFQESNATLSCLTCHNPHTDVSLDTAAYERKCLGCHTPGSSSTAENARPVTEKACPVNPSSGCIGCHMPKREAFPGMDMPTKMADHLIMVYNQKSGH